jgi:hypothetical protein
MELDCEPPFFFPSRPLAVNKPGKLSKPVPFFIPQFIIEGLLSFVIGVASIWMVQDWPEDAKFITPLERAMVLQRLKDDTGLASEGTFKGSVIKRAVLDWKTWVLALMYIGCAEPIYSQR